MSDHLLPVLVRAVRLAHGLSQADLAARMNIKTPTVSGFESGEHAMSERTLEGVAKALGVTVRDLLAEGLRLTRDRAPDAG